MRWFARRVSPRSWPTRPAPFSPGPRANSPGAFSSMTVFWPKTASKFGTLSRRSDADAGAGLLRAGRHPAVAGWLTPVSRHSAKQIVGLLRANSRHPHLVIEFGLG